MSDFSMFMKSNKIIQDNKFYPATKSLSDEKGQPLLWELKPVNTTENEAIQLECYSQNKNRDFSFNSSMYVAKLICASVVYPNLNDKKLQDSYGCYCPEDLIKEMISSPAEYKALADFVQGLCGFDQSFADKVDYAKN